MTVDTRKVARREVRYESLDEILADAERLAGTETRTLGNWSLGQIFQHLAQGLDASIDGVDMKMPWAMKLVFKWMFNKDKMLNNPMKPGFKIPKQGEAQFSPGDVSVDEGLTALRTAIDRCKTESHRAEHLLFGTLTREESDKFQMRHAEMHLSFVEIA